MGDQDPGAPGHRAGERLADLVFGHRVQACGHVVQDQHPAGMGEGPSQADPLGFTAGHRCLGQRRIISLRQSLDEVVSFGRPRRFYHLGPARGVNAERDCVGQLVADQDRPLEAVADRAAQGRLVQLVQGYTVEEHHPAMWIGQAPSQSGQQRLAGPGAAHDCDQGAGRDHQIKAVQDEPVAGPEGHPAKFHGAADRR